MLDPSRPRPPADPLPRTPARPNDGRASLSRGTRALLLAGFALLVALRLGNVWAQGRFLAEEATVFLAYAWHRPWLEALFRPFAGYWNAGANATTLLVVALVKGGLVTLERAPYLTMTMALAMQLLPALLLLTGRAPWLVGRPAVIAALLIVATAPATEEVFLNVLHIQFHLALCAALILALDPPRRAGGRLAYAALLFAAPLCGPTAIVIVPFFALRALIDRDRRRALQFGALALGAGVQLLLFYGTNPMRGHLLDPGTVASILFVRLIVMPIFGFGKAERIGDAIQAAQLAGGSGWWWAAAAAVLLFGGLMLIAARRRDAAIWLLLSALSIAIVSFGYGMVAIAPSDLFSVTAGERYNFLPLVLIGLTLVALAMRRATRARPLFIGLCLAFVVTGLSRYTRPLETMTQGPSWPAEVAAWRQDHRHPLAVWPASWAADLSDVDRRCPAAPGADAAGYCESGWAAMMLGARRDAR